MSQKQPFSFNGEYYRAVLGQNGFNVLTSGSATTPASAEYCAIQVISDTTLTCNVESGNELGDTTITSLALTAGTTIYGAFSAIDLATGSVIAYHSNDGRFSP